MLMGTQGCVLGVQFVGAKMATGLEMDFYAVQILRVSLLETPLLSFLSPAFNSRDTRGPLREHLHQC